MTTKYSIDVLALIVCLMFAFVFTSAQHGRKYAELKSSYLEPLITYSYGSNDVPFCGPNMACNIVHNRFWFSPIVLRLCRCLEKWECPWNWNEKDDHTMYINHRAQLKFCRKLSNLPQCTAKMEALTSIVVKNDAVVRQQVTATCYCPKMRYFDRANLDIETIENSTTMTTHTYNCKPYEKCRSGEFCGHITSNNFETYYVCTCPQKHICVMMDRRPYNVMEALYEGPAYRGVCFPRE